MSLDWLVDEFNGICQDLGAPLIVILFYWFRFRTLKGTRSYTTRALFSAGVITFITPFVIIYAVLPGKLLPLSAVWVVISVWLVPFVPATWRDFCQGLAGIPARAFALRDLLAASSFELRPDDVPVIRRKLGRIGYQIDDYLAVQSTAIQSRLLKITAILLHLERMSAKRETFIERNSEHYSDLQRSFDLLSFEAIRVLKNSAAIYGAIMEESKVQPDDWHALDSLAAQDSRANQLQLAAQTAAGGMLEDLRKDMDFLLDNLLLFVARSALSGEGSSSGRKRRLEAIGFTLNTPPSNVMWWVVATVVAVTVGSSLMWLYVLKGYHSPGDGEFGPEFGTMRIFVVSSMNLIVSFWLVDYLKRHYAFANEGMFSQVPTGFIVFAGLCSALLIFPVQAYFDYNQFHDRNFVRVVAGDLPLLLMPWSIAAMTALLVQDSTWRNFKSGRIKRVMDGVTFGTGMTLALLLIWSIHKISPVPVMEAMDGFSMAAMVLGVFAVTFAFGFVIGYLVIAPIRENSSLRRADRDMMSGAALMGT